MNKEEMLRKLKGIQLLYSMPMMAQNMRPEHFAIVEYEKMIYEQQAIIDRLTNNWNALEEWLKDFKRLYEGNEFQNNAKFCITVDQALDKMKEIKEKNNGN